MCLYGCHDIIQYCGNDVIGNRTSIVNSVYFCFSKTCLLSCPPPDTKWREQCHREATEHTEGGSWPCSHGYCSLHVQPDSLYFAVRHRSAKLRLIVASLKGSLTDCLCLLIVACCIHTSNTGACFFNIILHCTFVLLAAGISLLICNHFFGSACETISLLVELKSIEILVSLS